MERVICSVKDIDFRTGATYMKGLSDEEVSTLEEVVLTCADLTRDAE